MEASLSPFNAGGRVRILMLIRDLARLSAQRERHEITTCRRGGLLR